MFAFHKNALKFCNFGSSLFGWSISFVFNWKNRKDMKNISVKKKNPVHSHSLTFLGCSVDFDFGGLQQLQICLYLYYRKATLSWALLQLSLHEIIMALSTWAPAFFYNWWHITSAETQLSCEMLTLHVQSALIFPFKTLVTVPDRFFFFSVLLPCSFLTCICKTSGFHKVIFCHSKSPYQKTSKFIASPTQWDGWLKQW